MYVYNLTQHSVTAEQKQDGVRDLPERYQALVRGLLTFDTFPEKDDVERRARQLAAIAHDVAINFDDQDGVYHPRGAMIGGALWFMPALTQALKDAGFHVYFAYSPRVSKDIVKEDGTVEKVSTFSYQGLVEV